MYLGNCAQGNGNSLETVTKVKCIKTPGFSEI